VKLNPGLSWQKKALFTSKLDLNLRDKLVTCYIWSTILHGAENLTLQEVYQKYLESFETDAGESQLDRSCEK
jgi:hypothetical protein